MDEKYSGGSELSKADLEDIDMIYHALKSMKTYEAMEGNSGEGIPWAGIPAGDATLNRGDPGTATATTA